MAVPFKDISVPRGICRIEADTDVRVCTVIHAAAEANITFHLDFVRPGTGDISFRILRDIHIHRGAILRSEFPVRTNGILSSVDSFDCAASDFDFGSHGTQCFIGSGRRAIIGQNVHQPINGDGGHSVRDAVHGLDHSDIARRLPGGAKCQKFSGIVNVNGAAEIGKEGRHLHAVSATFCRNGHITGIIDIDDAGPDCRDSGRRLARLGIHREVVSLEVNGHLVIDVGAGDSGIPRSCCTAPVFIDRDFMAFGRNRRAVFRKDVGAVCFPDATPDVAFIRRFISRDGFRERISRLFRRLDAFDIQVRLSRPVCIQYLPEPFCF